MSLLQVRIGFWKQYFSREFSIDQNWLMKGAYFYQEIVIGFWKPSMFIRSFEFSFESSVCLLGDTNLLFKEVNLLVVTNLCKNSYWILYINKENMNCCSQARYILQFIASVIATVRNLSVAYVSIENIQGKCWCPTFSGVVKIINWFTNATIMVPSSSNTILIWVKIR